MESANVNIIKRKTVPLKSPPTSPSSNTTTTNNTNNNNNTTNNNTGTNNSNSGEGNNSTTNSIKSNRSSHSLSSLISNKSTKSNNSNNNSSNNSKSNSSYLFRRKQKNQSLRGLVGVGGGLSPISPSSVLSGNESGANHNNHNHNNNNKNHNNNSAAARKEELLRIVNKEEQIRKTSLFNLRQELKNANHNAQYNQQQQQQQYQQIRESHAYGHSSHPQMSMNMNMNITPVTHNQRSQSHDHPTKYQNKRERREHQRSLRDIHKVLGDDLDDLLDTSFNNNNNDDTNTSVDGGEIEVEAGYDTDDPNTCEKMTFVPLKRRDTNEHESMVSAASISASSIYSGYDSDGKPRSKSRSKRRRRNTFTDEELEKIPRLVHRNLPFKQSKQEIAVVNKTIYKGLKMQRILSQDWYHVILRYHTALSLFALLTMWTSVIIIFALIYMRIDASDPLTECGLGTAGNPIRFGPAFAFSLETCTTVGYGLPNSTNGFFEPECGHLQLFIYFQMVFSMLFNAFLFAFLFARLARCNGRGAQVLFSDKAIIEKRNGKWLMHVRVYDYDSSQPVVEAHVRMYCVSWRDYEKQTRDLVQPHLLHNMRILQPDDDLGAQLYTSIPLNVTHQIDAFSPLLPKFHKLRGHRMDAGGLMLREIDQHIDSAGIMCPVCGETYGSHAQLKKHISYNAIMEDMEPNFPIKGSHRDPDLVSPFLEEPIEVTESDMREHLKDKEIMVVVEGIEPMVSGTFQALQSYKLKDIEFSGRFAPCMSQQAGKIFVDVDRFHEVLTAGEDSMRNFNQYRTDIDY